MSFKPFISMGETCKKQLININTESILIIFVLIYILLCTFVCMYNKFSYGCNDIST